MQIEPTLPPPLPQLPGFHSTVPTIDGILYCVSSVLGGIKQPGLDALDKLRIKSQVRHVDVGVKELVG